MEKTGLGNEKSGEGGATTNWQQTLGGHCSNLPICKKKRFTKGVENTF